MFAHLSCLSARGVTILVASHPQQKCGAAWEPTLVNLGHVFRKQRRWADAVGAFQQALGLCPGQPGTYAALGYTCHLQARTACLCLTPNPRDPVSSTRPVPQAARHQAAPCLCVLFASACYILSLTGTQCWSLWRARTHLLSCGAAQVRQDAAVLHSVITCTCS